MGKRIGGLQGLGWTLAGWTVVAVTTVYAVAHALGMWLKCSWLNWTGRLPKR